MRSEDYKALQAMLEEFRRELETVTAQTDRAYRRIREADALILALTDVEPEDMKVFSPKRGRNYDREKIEEICRERGACEERCRILEENKAFLSRHIGTLEDILGRRDEEASGGREDGRRVWRPTALWEAGIGEAAKTDGSASGRFSVLSSTGSGAKAEPDCETAGGTMDARPGEKEKLDFLTEREKEILCQVAEGMLNKEIAASLNISEQTVKNHISNIFQKLGVADRTQAAVFAIKNGLGR